VHDGERPAGLVHGPQDGMGGIVGALQAGEIGAGGVTVHGVGPVGPAQATVETHVRPAPAPADAGRLGAGDGLLRGRDQRVAQAGDIGPVFAGFGGDESAGVGALVGVSGGEDDGALGDAGGRAERGADRGQVVIHPDPGQVQAG